VFSISVEDTFHASHAILIGGQREPLNGHQWRVVATIEGPHLDPEGLLCDFHAVQRALALIIAPFQNANLNHVPPFDKDLNPTAENVARHIARQLQQGLRAHLSREARVASVSVTEAPGCVATYRPPEGAGATASMRGTPPAHAE